MSRLPILSLLLLAAACGGEKASWATPEAALSAGAEAMAKGDYKSAAEAMSAASASSDAKVAYEAYLYLGEAQARLNRTEDAKASFDKAQNSSLFDAQGAQRIAEAWMHTSQFELAEAAVAMGETRFPDSKANFERVRAGIEAMKSGDADKMAELGYAGGD
ncbi:MAG: hypothetical protein EYC70_06615 [Planctomycetota bacterium]|nr:MAG: hypothetical protein EYC70_06615 [Planctomycetota bacterium]